MLGTVLEDLTNALLGVIDGAALPTLLIMGAVVVFKGVRTNGLGGVFGRAAAALLLMLVALYVVHGALAPERFMLVHWGTHTERSWRAVMDMTGQGMLGYYLFALVGVSAVFGIKQLLHRHR